MADKDDIRLLYQVLSSQIEFSKTQQWTMAYYTLLFIGGIVGFSELIYKMEYPYAHFGSIGHLVLFTLAVVVLPVTMTCIKLLQRNRESMRECREKFQKMWPHLSWPFNNGEGHLEGRRLVGRYQIHRSCVYRSTRYDRIFWFPAMFLTVLAGIFAYSYLLAKFWKTVEVSKFFTLLNFIIAAALSVLVFRIYSRWKTNLKRKARAQKRESKDTSLCMRIDLLVKWICTGQVPPSAHSGLYALLKCICKGQCPRVKEDESDMNC